MQKIKMKQCNIKNCNKEPYLIARNINGSGLSVQYCWTHSKDVAGHYKHAKLIRDIPEFITKNRDKTYTYGEMPKKENNEVNENGIRPK